MTHDAFGAFCPYPAFQVAPTGPGLLDGLDFAVKDLFDVAGVPTGAGSPEWLATHPVPTETAPAVSRLLAAGARIVGKTRTDELAYSLAGENAHYGTPINPKAPDRMPGGSSSGSAVAAAGGLVDFAIGSDTGGSVRLPASFCGVYGIRPTHGRIALDHVVPLAPAFDTVGWFAADADVFERVGAVYFPGPTPALPGDALLVAEDAFALAGPEVAEALASAIARVSARFRETRRIAAAPGELGALREVFRILQAREAWAAQGAWIEATRPKLGPGVAERFRFAATVGAEAAATAATARAAFASCIHDRLAGGAVLCLPSAPGPALRRGAPPTEIEAFRARALAILSIAGLAGLPQVSLPLAEIDGAPVGLSLAAAPGSDRALLALVSAIAREAAG